MRVEHEYDRGGALQYLAAWDVRRGRVLGRCEEKTGIDSFGRLVEQVMRTEPYRSASRVFWIVDNGSSHRGHTAVRRLRKVSSDLFLDYSEEGPRRLPERTLAARSPRSNSTANGLADLLRRTEHSRTESMSALSKIRPRSAVCSDLPVAIGCECASLSQTWQTFLSSVSRHRSQPYTYLCHGTTLGWIRGGHGFRLSGSPIDEPKTDPGADATAAPA